VVGRADTSGHVGTLGSAGLGGDLGIPPLSYTTTSVITPSNVTAVLLVGGMGTRLRPVVSATPKPLALVGDRTFLELLVEQLRNQGMKHLVMSSGYLADQIEAKFDDGRSLGLEIEYSRETSPLGTAGALKLAQKYITQNEFLVMNGDSFLDIEFSNLFEFHRQNGGIATMAVVSVAESGRYGTVRIDSNCRLLGFEEKSESAGPGLINAGVYVFDRAIFEFISDGPGSLEKDVFPRILDKAIYALKQDGLFIDIGLPKDYAWAQSQCRRLWSAALAGMRTK
jgi:D-glycero-alpha-D-manno-heptose 1-phosphate guanylyltransferase